MVMNPLISFPAKFSLQFYQKMVEVWALPVVRTALLVAVIVPLALYAYSQRHFVSTLAGAITH